MRRLSERGKPQAVRTPFRDLRRPTITFLPALLSWAIEVSRQEVAYIPSLRACLRTVAIAPARTPLDALRRLALLFPAGFFVDFFAFLAIATSVAA